MKGKLEAAKVLFEYKADANFCSLLVDKTWTKHPYFSETNVHRAINTNQFHFVDLFMSNGADLTIPNVKGSNPIHNICFCGQLDMLKLILKHRDNNISVRIALTKGMVTFGHYIRTKNVFIGSINSEIGKSLITFFLDNEIQC